MRSGRRLSGALAAAALSVSTTLAGTAPAGAAPAGTDRTRTPDAALTAVDQAARPLRAPVLSAPIAAGDLRTPTAARAYPRPLFAFWGKKYHRIDGFGFSTATRGSGTGVKIEAAWKTYRGVKPILPKVFVQKRVDGGRWTKVKGAKARISRRLVSARVPAHTVTSGGPVETVDLRFKSKKPRKAPRRARRSVTSDRFTVSFHNQATYTGDQARFYAPIATLCPNASITLDVDDSITGSHDGLFSWQHGITIDAVSLAASPGEPEVSKLGIAIHECAHMKQFYNWGGTNQAWRTLLKRSAEVFVADNHPDPNVATVPMAPEWSPMEHAADCAKELVSPERYRTYGGYCNAAEYAAAGLLWQDQRY